MDCRNPGAKDGFHFACLRPCKLDSGNRCQNDGHIVIKTLQQSGYLALFVFALSTGFVHAQTDLPNTSVLDQNGQSKLFYQDLIKDRIVVINFVFTRCRMVCPMAGFQFGRLRELLGDQAGQSVHLISVSSDASYDTPQRMKDWAVQFNAGKGWTQVTGEKQNIDQLLKSLKAFSADKQDHSTLVLVGNDRLSEWKWIDGGSNPQLILSALSKWQN